MRQLIRLLIVRYDSYHSVQKKKIPNQQLKVLDECMKIDPFYYDPQSFPTDEQYFQLWQVINHCRLIFSFRCYDHFTSIDVWK